ncbi:MAG: stage II sporulation protein R [Defluviitaleaceae bacterium]|nr:stage II sporulation protein R [Defluviitaleaceae bacterium]
MIGWLKKESKILLISLIIGVLFASGVAAYTFAYAVTVQRSISENVIRFHVMAHSNSAEEQLLKEYVKTEILEEFSISLPNYIHETREKFTNMLPEFQAHAEKVIRRAGFDHEVTAKITHVFFPTTFYGNIAFPPGMYEAVQISIGDGNGENWWCLMFPPLCYVDMTATDESRNLLAEAISEEGLRLILHQEDSSPELVIRFRVVEWWQNARRE